MRSICRGRTVLIVAHRLSTVRAQPQSTIRTRLIPRASRPSEPAEARLVTPPPGRSGRGSANRHPRPNRAADESSLFKNQRHSTVANLFHATPPPISSCESPASFRCTFSSHRCLEKTGGRRQRCRGPPPGDYQKMAMSLSLSMNRRIGLGAVFSLSGAGRDGRTQSASSTAAPLDLR
jgi:hypothetical protein